MMKKLSIIIVSVILVLILGMFSATAVTAPLFLGDIDSMGSITIKDATLVQKFLANITSFDKRQIVLAEVDGDGIITIKDATMIQKYCAKVIKRFPIPNEVRDNVTIESFYADYDSGKAMTCVPVTFTVLASATPDPITFDYYINDELIIKGSEQCTFTCTFDEAGTYNVKVVATNDFGTWTRLSTDYEVVEPYSSESVMVKAFYYDDNERPICPYDKYILFTAEPMFGSGVFEYAFYINDELVQDFSDDNKFMVEYFSEEGNYEIKAVISDTVSGEVASETIDVTVEMIAPA